MTEASVSFSSTQVAVSAVLLFLAYVLWEYRDRGIGSSRLRPDLWQLPGSKPIFGNLFEALKNQDRNLEAFLEGDRNKPAECKHLHTTVTVPTMRVIRLSKPEYIEHVQKTNFENYGKGHIFYGNTKQLLGDGIFSTDGHKWLVQRKATSKIFNGNAFRGIITQSLNRNLEVMHRILSRHAESGKRLFFRFTLNSFAELAFGTDIGALSDKTDVPVPFATAFDFCQLVVDKRFINPFWRITEELSGQGRKMRAAVKIIDEFSYNLIDERSRSGISGKEKSRSETDLLSLYLSIRDDSGKPLTKKQLRDAVLNLIIAGRDTTAQAASWTFYHLISNTQQIEKIRKEVDEMGTIDYDSFRTMTQTNATFQEGLRLHPSVPKNLWVAFGDDQIPNGGPSIKKGDNVLWVDYALGRDQELWGPTAEEFDPSRWIDEKGDLKKESQWKFHVFNGGSRLCLGQELAKFEGAAMIASVLKDFDLEFAPGYLNSVQMVEDEKAPMYATSLTLPMAAPMMVTVKPRAK